jgi:hypothetical protein
MVREAFREIAIMAETNGSKRPRVQGFKFSCVGVIEDLRELISQKSGKPWRRVASVAFMGGTAELSVDEKTYGTLKRGQPYAFDGRVKIDGKFTEYVVEDLEAVS